MKLGGRVRVAPPSTTVNRRRVFVDPPKRRVTVAPPVQPPPPKEPEAPRIQYVGSRRVLDKHSHDPAKQLKLDVLIDRILIFCQSFAEVEFYDYQLEPARRLVESVLLHDNQTLSVIMARQSGKTELLSALTAGLGVILPYLAKQYPDDWRLNITDKRGVYRGFSKGIRIGIYGPKKEQAAIMFERVRKVFERDAAKQYLRELGYEVPEDNRRRCRITNGSRILCESASEQSKIEGETHDLLIIEEAQDVGDQKVRKSLHPMVASTLGTICKIGTASIRKCDFYTTIVHNDRMFALKGVRNNFRYPWQVVVRFNSLYEQHIESEKVKLGADSDEFRMSYGCEWIFERGMFAPGSLLFHKEIAMRYGYWSNINEVLDPKLSHCAVVAGIDWGSNSDSTVVTFMAVNWNAPVESSIIEDNYGVMSELFQYKKHVLSWHEWIGDDYEHQFEAIKQLLDSTPCLVKVAMDSNSCGRPLYDRFKKVYANTNIEIEDFNFSAKLKSDGYKALLADLSGHRVTFPASPMARKEPLFIKFAQQMSDLTKTYDKGLMKVSHPEEKGAHDDFPDSFMVANWAASKPAFSNGIRITDTNLLYAA